jgi:hypothetical protein
MAIRICIAQVAMFHNKSTDYNRFCKLRPGSYRFVCPYLLVYFCSMLTRTLTKRQLGLLMVAAGALAFVAIIAIDIVDFGREGGIGPAQRIALGLAVVIVLVGLTLIPLKDQPA